MQLSLEPESHSAVALRPLIQGILDEVTLCTMSTVNPDGTAHINTAFFSVDSNWRMFFISNEDAKHSKNIKEQPSMAVAVFHSDQTWDDWKIGLQLFGRAEVARGPDFLLGARLYKQRFPAYAKWLHTFGRGIGCGSVPPFFMFVPDSLKILHEELLGEETFVTVALSRT